MTREKLEELAVAYGLGMLDQAAAAQLESLVANDANALREVASFADAAAAFAVASSLRVEPSVEQRTRILADIATLPQLPHKPTKTPAPEGYRYELSGSEGWVDTAVPGFRTKLLSRGRHPGCEVMLIALAPGAKVPDHDHAGSEEIYMLTGHLHTEGQVLGPGDFVRAEPGTHHNELISPDGCMALLILGPTLTE